MASLQINNKTQSNCINNDDDDHVEHIVDSHYDNQQLLDNDSLQNAF